MAGLQAFREAFLSADAVGVDEDYDGFAARQVRYAVLWAFYENTAYRNIHKWAQKFRTDFGLYKYIRNIYNPAFRLGDFWQTHLMGGVLDPLAGDGAATPSALPIVTEQDDALRLAVARLWQASNWQTHKDLFTLYGVVLGDVALRVVDDTERERVYLQVVHPGIIQSVEMDPFGNCKGYVFQEQRRDPRAAAGLEKTVTYTEQCAREGDDVVYRTLLDGAPYPWNGEAAEWREPYGFVPLVVVQHRSIGRAWGWSELQPALSKIREVDDQASKLSDQIRKTVDAKWAFIGASKPASTPTPRGAVKSAESPEPGREEDAVFYMPLGSDVKPLVAPLDLAGALAHVAALVEEIERDYPEIKFEILRLSGDTSGEALRVAQEPVEVKVNRFRPIYDDALARAQMMAVAIGGYRSYEGFAGFDLDSYAAGRLAHHIGKRGVFGTNPVDDLNFQMKFWQVANQAQMARLPLGLFLRRNGWSEEEVAAVLESPEYKALAPAGSAGDYP